MGQDHPRRGFLYAGLALAAARPAQGAEQSAGDGIWNVRAQGARGDGEQLDTRALQAAIDACGAAGGGTVYFPPGRYLTGGLRLRSGVHLQLEAGALLLGSKRLEDFPITTPRFRSYTDNYTERSLLYGEGLENVGIHGTGTIDGQGAAYEGPYKVRPYLIRIVSSRRASVTGVTIRDSPMWVQHYLACDDVLIHGVTVHSRVNHNNDGIDIDCCRRVTISDCNIWSGDDAIVLKSTAERPTRDVAITNCVLSSHCNAFKLGTESNGGFENITLSNCSIYETRLTGIALELVDGGSLDGDSIANVTMREVANPLFIRLGNRARPFTAGKAVQGAGVLRNVSINGVTATGANTTGCAISGIPGHRIENLSIENVSIEYAGGVSTAPEDAPEQEAEYPEYKMFGALPAYGIFLRHASGVRLRNVRTRTVKPDPRPALVGDDVVEFELRDSSLAATGSVVRLRDARGVMIQGCRIPATAEAFVEASGGLVSVCLMGNDLTRARRAVTGDDRAITLLGNYEGEDA